MTGHLTFIKAALRPSHIYFAEQRPCVWNMSTPQSGDEDKCCVCCLRRWVAVCCGCNDKRIPQSEPIWVNTPRWSDHINCDPVADKEKEWKLDRQSCLFVDFVLKWVHSAITDHTHTPTYETASFLWRYRLVSCFCSPPHLLQFCFFTEAWIWLMSTCSTMPPTSSPATPAPLFTQGTAKTPSDTSSTGPSFIYLSAHIQVYVKGKGGKRRLNVSSQDIWWPLCVSAFLLIRRFQLPPGHAQSGPGKRWTQSAQNARKPLTHNVVTALCPME